MHNPQHELAAAARFRAANTYYYNLKNHERAIQHYVHLIEDFPRSSEVTAARQRIGECYAALGKHREAINEYESLLASGVEGIDRRRMRLNIADLYYDLNDLGQALEALVPWALKKSLDEEAPTHFEAPTGNRHAIDYEGVGAPALHIRVQELFGLESHPGIAGGRLPLTLHLLSPAHRPIQITRDLPGFWKGSWAAVKAEMKGRYPRHPWPDDPASAAPTARAKPRGT